jgi:hypothetical protein
MVELRIPTPALAKKIWESMPNATTRRVAGKLRQSGFSISHMTVSRWRNRNWRPLEREPRHPLEAARALLDDAVPLLTGDAMSTWKSFVQESGEREALDELTDDEIQRRAAREIAIAVYVISKAVVRQAALVLTRPVELGILMRALAACAQATTAVLAK